MWMRVSLSLSVWAVHRYPYGRGIPDGTVTPEMTDVIVTVTATVTRPGAVAGGCAILTLTATPALALALGTVAEACRLDGWPYPLMQTQFCRS